MEEEEATEAVVEATEEVMVVMEDMVKEVLMNLKMNYKNKCLSLLREVQNQSFLEVEDAMEEATEVVMVVVTEVMEATEDVGVVMEGMVMENRK